jgi:DNA repair protein SbcC/Rad50
MIINKIKLKNFGAHKNINFETNGQRVIGLLGKNGSGKSTILNAIKFAFTGDIEGTIESNLRHGSTTGSVEIEFVKNNETGRINRSVGKTSKANLTWRGKSYSVKKEIEFVLLELLGVDKKSLSNAVFLNQGSLNRILFGSDADREELFIKVMNVSYCQKFADILDQKSKTLKDANDSALVVDELNRQRIILSEKIDSHREDLANYPNCDSEIETLETREKLINLLVGSINKINEDKNLLAQYTQELKTIIDSDFEEVSEHQKKIEDANKELFQVKERIKLQTSINRIKVPLEDLTASISSLREDHTRTKIELDHLESQKDVHDKLKEEANKLEFEHEQMSKWLAIQKEAFDSYENADDTKSQCFKCGLLVSRVTESELNKLIHLCRSLGDEACYKKNKFREFKNLYDSACKKELEAYEFLNDTIKECANLEQQLSDLDSTPVIGKLDNSSVDFLHNLKLSKEKSISKLSERLEYILELTNKKTKFETLVQEKNTAIESGTSAVEEIQKQLDSLPTYGKEISHYKGVNSLRNETRGKIEELQSQLTDTSKRHGELLEENDESERKKIIYSELKKLKDIFSRKGLPKSYVDSRFSILTELTQKNLETLETDFFINQSQEKSLAFDYTIVYDGDNIELPMNKLSGGQRVRLSLAFILAVQQLIVAELGFITLDEPSTHLDEEGVDSLCNLLKKVRDVFADSEHQLWVCDHNPKLEAAFDKILKLT